MSKRVYITGAVLVLLSLAVGGWLCLGRSGDKSEQMLLEEYTRASRDCFLAIKFEEECPKVGQIKLILMSRGIEPRIVKLPPTERVR